MALSDVEISRLADAAAALRPDWPARSVRAHLAARHRHRAFADVAVALAVVAADPASETPARLDEAGPWWSATKANRPQDATPIPSTPHCPIHPEYPTGSKACPACTRENTPAPNLRALIAEEAS